MLKNICPHFKRTKLPVPEGESECSICPLRNKKGDCIKDIVEDKGLEIEQEISEIWRIFYAKRK